MRKITKDAVNKFLSRETFKKSNMEVEKCYNAFTGSVNEFRLKLHGNTIAILDEFNMLSISNAGWASNTTKERLNGLPNVRINQKNWTWYLNGNEWSGEWTRVGTV
jgi:hypothetical protein